METNKRIYVLHSLAELFTYYRCSNHLHRVEDDGLILYMDLLLEYEYVGLFSNGEASTIDGVLYHGSDQTKVAGFTAVIDGLLDTDHKKEIQIYDLSTSRTPEDRSSDPREFYYSDEDAIWYDGPITEPELKQVLQRFIVLREEAEEYR